MVACESTSVLENANSVLENDNCVCMSSLFLLLSLFLFFLLFLFFSLFSSLVVLVFFRRCLIGRRRRCRLISVSAAARAKVIRESTGTLTDKTTVRAHQRSLVRRREGLISRQCLQLFHLSCSVNSTVFILFQPLSLSLASIVASLRRACALVILHVCATPATFVDLRRRISRFQGFENGVDLDDVVVDIFRTQTQIKLWHTCGDAVQSVASYGTGVLLVGQFLQLLSLCPSARALPCQHPVVSSRLL